MLVIYTAAPHDKTAEMNSFAYKKNIETFRGNVTIITEVCVIYWLFVQVVKVGDINLDMQQRKEKPVKKA